MHLHGHSLVLLPERGDALGVELRHAIVDRLLESVRKQLERHRGLDVVELQRPVLRHVHVDEGGNSH